jgi:flagellar biosynthesis protein FlhB
VADLQQEDRTHEASPRRIAQARSAGRIPLSADLSASVVILAAGAALLACGRGMMGDAVILMRGLLAAATSELPASTALLVAARTAGATLAVPIAAILAAAVGIGLLQTRGLVTARRLAPEAKRLAPRLGRLLSRHNALMSAKDVVKLGLLAVVMGIVVRHSVSAIVRLSGSGASRILDGIFALARHVGVTLACTAAVWGVADYLWQLHQNRKTLRMSHDEVKRELKEDEGDAALRTERKRVHAELLQAYALTDVAQADVVVLVSGQVAIALRYAPEVADAPVVVRKGRRSLALRIETVATQAGVPIVANHELAHQLAETEAGNPIPETLYEAVAEVLAAAKPALPVAPGNQNTEPADGG